MDNEVVFPKFRWVVALAEAWAWLTFAVVSLTFSPMLPAMAREFGQPIGSVVIAVFAASAFASGAAIICIGPLVDKLGPRKMLLWSSILMLLYCVLIPFCSSTLGRFSVLRIFQGLSVAPVVASLAALTRRWFPHKEQGMVLGFSNAMYPVGIALLFIMVPILMQSFHGNWRHVAALGGIIAAIQVILSVTIMFGKEPEMPRPAWWRPGMKTPRNDFKVALVLSVFWTSAVLLTIGQGILQSVNQMFASFLIAPPPVGLGWEAVVAGRTTGFIQLGMIVSGMVMGFLLHTVFRGSPRWLAAFTFLGTALAVCLMFIVFTHNRPSTVSVIFFCIGALMNLGWPTVTAFITANYPPHILGRVFAISSGISLLGGAVFTAICGVILNITHGFSAVFGFISLVALVASILAACTLKPVKAFQEQPGAFPGKEKEKLMPAT